MSITPQTKINMSIGVACTAIILVVGWAYRLGVTDGGSVEIAKQLRVDLETGDAATLKIANLNTERLIKLGETIQTIDKNQTRITAKLEELDRRIDRLHPNGG